jgi:phospholipid-binding lipoprotein MlaA
MSLKQLKSSWPKAAAVRMAAVMVAVAVSGCASLPAGHAPDERDPWERYNRAVYQFNDSVDRAVIKPVAEVYRDYFPDLFKFLLGNFFSNLKDVATTVHHLAQGKPAQAGESASRVLFNTTIGFFGLGDPASEMGFNKSSEDFGQTFGVWGAQPGPYVVLPLLGPSTVRDTIGLGFDMSFDPAKEAIESGSERSAANALIVIDRRASLLQAEGTLDAISFDRYAGFRNAFLARRLSQVYDGDPPVTPMKAD